MDNYTELVCISLGSFNIVVDIETGADVALHAHTVEVACFSDRLQESEDVILLGCLIFVVIVIEELYSGRSVLSCKLECLSNVVITNCLLPVTVSHSPIICGRFIDYVPGIDNAGIILFAPVHDLVDIVFHSLEHELSACEISVDIIVLIEEPRRCL